MGVVYHLICEHKPSKWCWAVTACGLCFDCHLDSLQVLPAEPPEEPLSFHIFYDSKHGI